MLFELKIKTFTEHLQMDLRSIVLNTTAVVENIPSSGKSVFSAYKIIMDYYNTTVNIPQERTLWTSFYFAAMFLTLIGNIFILKAIYNKVFCIGKLTTSLIFHVALSDMGLNLVSIFPTFITVLTDRWLFGELFCDVQCFTRAIFTIASMGLVCALNCSKLATILFPLRVRHWKRRLGHFLSTVMWGVALVSMTMYRFTGQRKYVFLYQLMSCWYITSYTTDWSPQVKISVIIYSGVSILGNIVVLFTTVWLLVTTIQLMRRQTHLSGTKLSGVLTVILIATVYCLTYMPYAIYNMAFFFIADVQDKNPASMFYTRLLTLSRSVQHFNTISNFFLYIFSISGFKNFVVSEMRRVLSR